MADIDNGALWANNVGALITAHQNTKAVTDTAEQVGQGAVQDFQNFKEGAGNYVRNDPTALPTTLQIIPHTVAGMVAHLPPDQSVGMATDLATEVGAHVASEAVRGAADVHEGHANMLLDRVGDLIPAEQHDELRGYARAMEGMRQADAEAASRDGLRQVFNNSDAAAIQHLGSLSHPDTGQLQFPPAWGQRMAKDPRLLAPTQAALMRAYAQLQIHGEPSVPNADVVTRVLTSAADNRANTPNHPAVAQIISEAGRTLSAQDAAWLASRVGPQPPAVRDENAALADTLRRAQGQIGNANAYGRFVSWFLPAYQRATAQGAPWGDFLAPDSKGYVLAPERMERFMPNGNDVVANLPRRADRPSLKEIFSRG